MIMSKSKKVHQIFALLNANAPDGYASHAQLLSDASCLVDLFDGSANEPNFDLRIGSRPIYECSSDVVMNDHPWRLVCEERSVMEVFEMEEERYEDAFQQAKYLMEYAA
jgi:hypothetical protein